MKLSTSLKDYYEIDGYCIQDEVYNDIKFDYYHEIYSYNDYSPSFESDY